MLLALIGNYQVPRAANESSTSILAGKQGDQKQGASQYEVCNVPASWFCANSAVMSRHDRITKGAIRFQSLNRSPVRQADGYYGLCQHEALAWEVVDRLLVCLVRQCAFLIPACADCDTRDACCTTRTRPCFDMSCSRLKGTELAGTGANSLTSGSGPPSIGPHLVGGSAQTPRLFQAVSSTPPAGPRLP